ncbi:3-oxoacyl-ACP reductase [Virgibacillus pantothenticus]|uniref:3-oxoacyl-ACP reductase n=1 Tax=Virgibacillus pantothenticus TaxID=1473 RepID=UPI001C22BF1F|nr:3-oxoacyl-ACP reductase [Virgibacillus pantothenticus]MBU8567021.1 3-oxoacyl-ACP reductase [Virgibacillus pantothenticus]MBU8601945.1 3-oxoacyl-ACP reductase [Virgibacillus pantothenticus]MBU8635048.1 3-oxoacyl-ACP reductase [Virgibacillus pantothenticus]MBU8642877.1 3-oxoacyl-ACP reductase [Virgibacillus pantothenticus]MBU8646837.1 3-oxoacyl-ACP reductase [Virgibacillus pantothenticus]
MDLKEQVVLVTGASRGLGAAIAKAFGETGAKVVVNYFMNKEKAEEVVEQIGNERALAIQADVRNLEEVNALFVKARNYFKKPITTIVNNALIDFTFNGELRNKLDSIKWNEFQTQFEGSVKAAFHTLQAGRADMVNQNFGRIINIGTNLVQNPVVPYHDYNTGKAALLGFTRSMAKELGTNGITVNMVSGGLLNKTDASAETPDAVFKLIKEETPLQKATTPEDVADVVLFFASPLSRAVTGQNLVVDGGLVMN